MRAERLEPPQRKKVPYYCRESGGASDMVQSSLAIYYGLCIDSFSVPTLQADARNVDFV